MRLKSVTLRHYRIHRELKVELDAARTLIGGPNESGKSTLVEALHRVFFLRAKGNTELHRAMVSSEGGNPEVEVQFAAGDETWQLRKRFGANGTVTLSSSAAATLAGDAAEAELARLLTVEAGVAGKAALAQWAHLWIWQGCSGDDPLEHAAAQQVHLLRRLQEEGGAAAMQSELDARVSGHFAAEVEGLFTQAGKPKSGSALERAETAAGLAEAARQSAAARVENSRQHGRDFEEATQTLGRLARDSAALAEQKLAVDGKLVRADELRAQESREANLEEALAKTHDALDGAHRQIAQLRAGLEAAEAALAPESDETVRLTETRDGARAQAEAAGRAWDAACDRTRAARRRRDLAVALQGRLEKAARLAEIIVRKEQAKAHEEEVSRLRTELAGLPEIDAAQLQALRRLEGALAGAETRLQTMAAGLELLAAAEPVLIGGVPLAVGEARILTEETEVAVGQTLRLLVRPGGGTSLAEARQEAQAARQAFQTALESRGVVSVAAAVEAAARRSDIAARIKQAEALLLALDAARLPAAFADARDASAAADAEAARRAAAVPDFTAPATVAEATRMVSEEERALHEAEAGEAQGKDLRELAAAASQRAEEALASRQQAIAQQKAKIADLQAQLRLLVETHGEETPRAVALARARAELTAAGEVRAGTRRALAELQIELLQSDARRLQEALERAGNEKREAELKQAVARAGLRSDGADDPEAALAVASARVRSAQEHLAGVRRKADALRLVHCLFQEEQRALADRFTRPLAERISGYLECLFGPGARANVVLAENAFSGLQLVRPAQGGGALPFDHLSGGAREQVAAAVRLAMAEVLCQDHHGCLPVIFDDAFAYADPERVQTLQRMLWLAADRGLQVIVLTCAPSDYAALGATHIALRIEQRPPGAAPARTAPSGEGAETGGDAAPDFGAATEEQSGRLLSALREIGGKAGNLALRQSLGWDESTYETVKAHLVTSGQLTTGRGRGGSVALPSFASDSAQALRRGDADE
jgi:energy-coupling factor transporter ATP-binding protein EcfA2